VADIDFPEWADEMLSIDLPMLRSRGEGQELEYKKEFPQNASNLGKEIAAFATSNGGTILIGVADSGDLAGLPPCKTSEGRDQMIRRLEGISKGTVKPAITPTAKFAIENDVVVLVITVPKGTQPVYYSNNIPYLRHLTEARPAEPHEVVDLVSETLNISTLTESESIEKSQFYSEMARLLIEILIIAEQADKRRLNPWLDIWKSEYVYSASELRELSVSQLAIDENLDGKLKELADALDYVGNLRLTTGMGNVLEDSIETVGRIAQEVLKQHIQSVPLSDSSLEYVRDKVVSSSRKLNDIISRTDDMINSGRIEEFQEEASDIGHSVLKLSYYNLELLGDNFGDQLKCIGRELHLTETMLISMDGGASVRNIVNHVNKYADKLNDLVMEIHTNEAA